MKLHFFYSIILTFISITTFGQRQLIEIIEPGAAVFSTEDQATLTKLLNVKENPRFTDAWPVSIAEIDYNSKEIQGSITLPGVKSELQYFSEHNYEIDQTLFGKTKFSTWGGKIDGPRRTGEFLLLKLDIGGLGGMIQFNGHIFELLPLNKKAGILRRVDHSFTANQDCGLGLVEGEKGKKELNSSTLMNPCGPTPAFANQCRKTWTILNAYTQATIDYIVVESGGNPFIQALYVGIPKATFNSTLINSNITFVPPIAYTDLNIGVYNHEDGIGDELSDFNTFVNSNYSNYDRIVLMSMHVYDFGVSGIAQYPYSSGTFNANADVAIVRFPTFFFPELTYAHELGHTFGGAHDIGDNPQTGIPCPRGVIFGGNGLVGGEDRTLMATLFVNPSGGIPPNAAPSSSATMILSDPNNTYPFNGQNVPIGSVIENNRNVIYNTLCEVYNFKSEVEDVHAKFLNTPDGNDNIVAFPNPVINTIFLDGFSNSNELKLFSIAGQEINIFSYNENKVDVSHLESGMYFFVVQTGKEEKTIKFVKE